MQDLVSRLATFSPSASDDVFRALTRELHQAVGVAHKALTDMSVGYQVLNDLGGAVITHILQPTPLPLPEIAQFDERPAATKLALAGLQLIHFLILQAYGQTHKQHFSPFKEQLKTRIVDQYYEYDKEKALFNMPTPLRAKLSATFHTAYISCLTTLYGLIINSDYKRTILRVIYTTTHICDYLALRVRVTERAQRAPPFGNPSGATSIIFACLSFLESGRCDELIDSRTGYATNREQLKSLERDQKHYESALFICQTYGIMLDTQERQKQELRGLIGLTKHLATLTPSFDTVLTYYRAERRNLKACWTMCTHLMKIAIDSASAIATDFFASIECPFVKVRTDMAVDRAADLIAMTLFALNSLSETVGTQTVYPLDPELTLMHQPFTLLCVELETYAPEQTKELAEYALQRLVNDPLYVPSLICGIRKAPGNSRRHIFQALNEILEGSLQEGRSLTKEALLSVVSLSLSCLHLGGEVPNAHTTLLNALKHVYMGKEAYANMMIVLFAAYRPHLDFLLDGLENELKASPNSALEPRVQEAILVLICLCITERGLSIFQRVFTDIPPIRFTLPYINSFDYSYVTRVLSFIDEAEGTISSTMEGELNGAVKYILSTTPEYVRRLEATRGAILQKTYEKIHESLKRNDVNEMLIQIIVSRLPQMPVFQTAVVHERLLLLSLYIESPTTLSLVRPLLENDYLMTCTLLLKLPEELLGSILSAPEVSESIVRAIVHLTETIHHVWSQENSSLKAVEYELDSLREAVRQGCTVIKGRKVSGGEADQRIPVVKAALKHCQERIRRFDETHSQITYQLIDKSTNEEFMGRYSQAGDILRRAQLLGSVTVYTNAVIDRVTGLVGCYGLPAYQAVIKGIFSAENLIPPAQMMERLQKIAQANPEGAKLAAWIREAL
ncbi:hypothetical protein GMRT_11920 [Giardia muris]|uniref:Uncharacterized protein n=1 Tax=Giardia muris TaxID=5742 RepID=A0A4Z1SRJ5_GIAMU|nr:hypothetical protein GMRT_11920 [Giardia muris]|eukprot:TNJ28534.1 hypothetical protein GMRT_11920 [Giardia muris]